MANLKKQLAFETTFDTYVADELIGEGGSGRVFGAAGADGTRFAIKVLASNLISSDKRRRFKNEIEFLSRTRHPNIVSLSDHGVSRLLEATGPFYVMPRFDGSLREVMRDGVAPNQVMRFFSQILDGIEAAHLLKAVHRDLKPENILYQRTGAVLAIADFGIAKFSEEIIATLIQTGPFQRLANFQYAAPEQRMPGQAVGEQADIYALGLILNEMFTGVIPHGTNYRQIASIDNQFAFLDAIVAQMLAQEPAERPTSIAEVKRLIARYEAESITRQRLSEIDNTVVKSAEISDPLALEPPRLVDLDWNRGRLTLILDRPVSGQWIHAFLNMPNVQYLSNKPPHFFHLEANRASVEADEQEIPRVVEYFKGWLPKATQTLKQTLDAANRQQEDRYREQLRRERDEEEKRLRVLKTLPSLK